MWVADMGSCGEVVPLTKAEDIEYSFRGSLQICSNEERYLQEGVTAIVTSTTACTGDENSDCKANKVNCRNEGSLGNCDVGIKENLHSENFADLESEVEEEVMNLLKSAHEFHVTTDSEDFNASSLMENTTSDDRVADIRPSDMLLTNCSEANLHIEQVYAITEPDNSKAGPLSGIVDENIKHASENCRSSGSYTKEKNDQVFSCMESKDGFENEMQQTSSIPEIVSPLLEMSANCVTDGSSSLYLSNQSVTDNSPLNLDDAASVTIGTVRRRNPARNTSSRKSNKEAPKSRSKNVRKSKKSPKLCTSLIEVLKAISGVVTKKRRHSPRCSRISVWGAPGILFEMFTNDDEPLHSKKKGSKRGKSSKGRKCPVNRRTKTEIVPGKTEQVSLACAPHNSVTLNSNDSIGSLTPVNVSECKYEHGGGISMEGSCWSNHIQNQNPLNGDRDQESNLTQEVYGENTLSDCHEIQPDVVNEESVNVTDTGLLVDPNTSPDSVVIHPPVDCGNMEYECVNPSSIQSFSKGICFLVLENFSEAATSASLQYTHGQDSGKREKSSAFLDVQEDIRGGESVYPSSGDSSEGTSLDPLNLSKNGKTSRKSYERRKKCSKVVENPNISLTEDLTCKKDICIENRASSSVDFFAIRDVDSTIIQNLPSTSSSQLQKSNGRNNHAACRRKQSSVGKKTDSSKRSSSKGVSKRKIPQVQSLLAAESQMNDKFKREDGENFWFTCAGSNSLSSSKADGSSGGFMDPVVCKGHVREMELKEGSEDHGIPKREAWVSCDDCHKWRSIAVELADAIDETGCRWTCKDNKDKTFADCSIPQEKTNAEINAELDISDASCDEDLYTERRFTSVSDLKPPAIPQSAWVHISSNIFLHRARKSQTIDEVMICQCKPPLNGSLGCGDECLNRMLNIECTLETCPCGNLCSNQQFQKREYAKLKYYRCGKKGFGLKLSEDVREGQFLIEYVGEVLDVAAHEARQREYAARGQKHFYFMTLNGNEVIDACAKGNLGRFINHSCEPNCCTEKWMINGEVCVGLFATRDIKKGEEVTFDYNYVRVFGAAAKRCLCGSKECRGYIGGDPSNSEILVHSDSDDEHPEPVMISENGEKIIELVEENSEATDPIYPQHNEENTKKEEVITTGADFPSEKNDVLDQISPIDHSSEVLASTLNNVDQELKDVLTCVEKPKASRSPNEDLKSSHSSSEMKKRSSKTKKSMVQHKEKPASLAPHVQPSVSRTGHHDRVEEKLNELLDSWGGLNKHRDATKGYLKLLVFSATSENETKSELSQSTRDLSLILDALLKTRSRTVLVDVINKNGLQLLHNIMKQNRRNFSRIPVIRKLLKVLEFLAVKEIITPEHMCYLPSNAEVESFRDSIIRLTYHNDVQVHEMARKFRDRWLPRKPKNVYFSERDYDRSNRKRQNSNWFPPGSSKRVNVDHTPGPTQEVKPSRPRKRISRWDQKQWPIPEINSQEDSNPQMEKSTAPEELIEEVPPGFGPPLHQPVIGTDLSVIRAVASMGYPQQQFIAPWTVSYGIPLTLAEQLGTDVDQDKALKTQLQPRWEVAPGMPFYPFPPLPSMPHN